MGCGSSKDTTRKFRKLLAGIEKEVRALDNKTDAWTRSFKSRKRTEGEPQSGDLQIQVTVRMQKLDEGIQEIQRSGKFWKLHQNEPVRTIQLKKQAAHNLRSKQSSPEPQVTMVGGKLVIEDQAVKMLIAKKRKLLEGRTLDD